MFLEEGQIAVVVTILAVFGVAYYYYYSSTHGVSATQMKPPLVLHYFNLRARAEPLHMLFYHAGLPYRHDVMKLEVWSESKHNFPAGQTGNKQLPVLELTDGTLLPESMDIAKYIAERCQPSLCGSSPEAQAKAERLWKASDTKGFGMINPILNWFPVEDSVKMIPAYMATTLPAAMDYLASELEEGPFFCGEDLTFCDFCVFHYLNNMNMLDGGANMSKKENLVKFYELMETLDSVKTHLAKRPQAGSVGRSGSLLKEAKDPATLPCVKDALKKVSK